MPRKPKLTLIENRLTKTRLIVTVGNAQGDETWAFEDTGRKARRDVCRRLLSAGKIVGTGDGLFADMDQTYCLANPSPS